jgi:hypothetical protein
MTRPCTLACVACSNTPPSDWRRSNDCSVSTCCHLVCMAWHVLLGHAQSGSCIGMTSDNTLPLCQPPNQHMRPWVVPHDSRLAATTSVISRHTTSDTPWVTGWPTRKICSCTNHWQAHMQHRHPHLVGGNPLYTLACPQAHML